MRKGKTIVVPLDERTAAFLALGHAKRTNLPSALICTSGSVLLIGFPPSRSRLMLVSPCSCYPLTAHLNYRNAVLDIINQ